MLDVTPSSTEYLDSPSPFLSSSSPVQPCEAMPTQPGPQGELLGLSTQSLHVVLSQAQSLPTPG